MLIGVVGFANTDLTIKKINPIKTELNFGLTESFTTNTSYITKTTDDCTWTSVMVTRVKTYLIFDYPVLTTVEITWVLKCI